MRCLELIHHYQASDKERLQTDTGVGKILSLDTICIGPFSHRGEEWAGGISHRAPVTAENSISFLFLPHLHAACNVCKGFYGI